MQHLSLSSTVKLPSGYEMPLIGLGVYENPICAPVCEAALKHGYRHIDTAQYYCNEREVGKAVKASGLAREEIFITSKVYHTSPGYNLTSAVVERSLVKLDTSYIDLYLIHSPLSGKEKRIEAYQCLLDKQREGEIRSVGVSNYGVKHLEEIQEAGMPKPSVNQIELHPLCQQRPIVEYCRKNDIVIQAYCPIIRGDFSNETLQAISKKYQREPVHILLRWSIQHGFAPLPKTSSLERVVSNVNVFDFELLSEDMDRLDALDMGGKGATSWNPVDAE